jgi:hypothetical protein
LGIEQIAEPLPPRSAIPLIGQSRAALAVLMVATRRYPDFHS